MQVHEGPRIAFVRKISLDKGPRKSHAGRRWRLHPNPKWTLSFPASFALPPSFCVRLTPEEQNDGLRDQRGHVLRGKQVGVGGRGRHEGGDFCLGGHTQTERTGGRDGRGN